MHPLCPADGTTLTRLEVLGRGLQSCPKCGGTFLASADLSSLTRLSAKALKLDPTASGTMGCPNCGQKLCTASAAGQEVQACPGCSGVWLGPGGLRRLMGSVNSTPEPGTPRTRVWLAGAALLLFLAWLVPVGLEQLRQSRLGTGAEQAWQLKDAGALESLAGQMTAGETQRLTRARAEYLGQDFLSCLNLLVGQDSDEARDLLKLAEDGWLAQVSWPGKVMGTLSLDLDQDTDRELVRVSDPGLGDPNLEVEVLARRRRVYQPITVEFRKSNGKPLEKPETAVALLEIRSERVTEHADGLLFVKLKEGGFALDLISADEDKILRYRFESDTPVKVKDAKITTSQGVYTFQEDHFTKS